MSNESTNIIETMSAELEHLRPMEASLEMAEANVKAYKQRIAVLEKEVERLKNEADKVIAELKAENRFVKERLEQQEKTFKWHKVEMLLGKLTGDLPSRDLNRVYGRDFLVHYTVKYGNCISHGIAYSDYDEEEGFFELEDDYIPVHWCEVPLPPIADKFKEAE